MPNFRIIFKTVNSFLIHIMYIFCTTGVINNTITSFINHNLPSPSTAKPSTLPAAFHARPFPPSTPPPSSSLPSGR